MKRAVTSALAMLLGTLCLAAIGAASALALVPDGNQGWYWQMPQPSGDLQGLYDVTMPSATQAWAVGSGGLIFHSADAGASWTEQTSGTTAELWSVEFADDHDGWVLGGVLLRTTDAGATWTGVTPSGVKSPSSLSVVGPDECWLGARAGVLAHTTDGGATWQIHHLNTTGALSVDFVDASHGWAKDAKRRLWRTVDGGATWALATSNLLPRGWFSSLRFTDQNHGWLWAYSRTTRVWTTSDAGATWHMVLKSRGRRSFDGPLVATDSSHAWLAEEDYPITPYDSGPVSYLLRTGDGGATWSRTCVGSTPLGALAAKGDTLISLSYSGPARSTDGGATWTSSASEPGYSFSAAQAVSANNVWATDQHGALLHSSDGLHWQEQPDPVRWSVDLNGLSFPDAADGWLVGNEPFGVFGDFGTKAVLLHTVNAGATWQRAASPLPGILNAVDFVDTQHGWVVSGFSSDQLARTTDGGHSWTRQRVGGRWPQLTAVDFVDTTHGWAAGSREKRISRHAYTQTGAIFATVDGGSTWRRQDIPGGTQDVAQVEFLDAENGWAVGDGRHGWVAHTTDGGRTWTRLAGLAREQFSSVHFTDSSHGWLAGYGIYATSDGGATWQRVATGGSDAIIAAGDVQHVWAFADGGLVSTVDGAGDLAAPTTFDDADWAWHASAQTLHLWPSDLGGSGLASTQYSLDGGSSWQAGTAVDFAAPANHSLDGTHDVLYRSSDAAGNVESTRRAKVRIDTLGPKCAVPWKTVVDAGTKGILRFKAIDATSGVARAEITISDRGGRVVRRFVRRAGHWDQYPRPPYFWIRFAADLKPGYYRVTVTAEDQAGNAQVRTGHNLLHVVASGAPKQRAPHWEQGLPANFFQTGSSTTAGAGASRRLLPYVLRPR